MNAKRIVKCIALSLLAVSLTALLACNSALSPTATPAGTPKPAQFPLSITDSNGGTVTFDKAPERIVAFDSAAVEVLFTIGEGRRVVGTHAFVSYPPETKDIPKVGDAFNINFEKVVELKPDLIYVFNNRFVPDLKKLGLKVLYIDSLNQDLPDITRHIRLWGEITGSTTAAEEVAARFESRISSIKSKLASATGGPRVYQHEMDFWTPGGDTLNGRIFTMLKAQNIAQDISGWAQISSEVIVSKDPEVIITTEQSLKEITDNPAFKNVSAVKNNRVYAVDPDLLSVAGPRVADSVETIARLLYPDLFKTSFNLPFEHPTSRESVYAR